MGNVRHLRGAGTATSDGELIGTQAREAAVSNNFRDLIPAADHPRIAGIAERDAYSHAAHALATRARVQGLLEERRARLNQPFRGITTNGDVVPDLYELADEGAPTGAMVEAARTVLKLATE